MRRAVLPDFSARQLEAVLALAEYGSFVAAAAAMRLSQPALTRAVQRLETQVSDLSSRLGLEEDAASDLRAAARSGAPVSCSDCSRSS